MRKEIIDVLTDDIQKEMERGKMRSEMINVLTDDIQKEMERGKYAQRND
jgi:hypothetical protein